MKQTKSYIFKDKYEIVKTDFDEISELNEPNWNHNNCYFTFLLKHIPDNVQICLDIGCGKGELSGLLAKKAQKVIAVDISEKMIEKAKLLHKGNNIEYICKNILDMEFSDNSLDIVITTATAHHLPFEWLLQFAKNKLKKDGKLILLDLSEAKTLSDHFVWSIAAVPNIVMNLIKNGKLQKDDAYSRDVWERHGKHDTYMTIKEIRVLAEKLIPGAKVYRKLFWRYLLIWQKI